MPIYKSQGKKDGLQKYLVRINYGDNQQLTRTAYGLEQAKDLERKLSLEMKNSDNKPAKKMSVGELFDEYISAKKYEVKETTVDKAIRDFNYYILPKFKDIRIDKLTPATLQEWKLEMEQKGLAYRTKKQAYGDFRACLNYAVKRKLSLGKAFGNAATQGRGQGNPAKNQVVREDFANALAANFNSMILGTLTFLCLRMKG